MVNVDVLLLVLAFIAFVVACFPVATRINLIALGLALWVASELVGHVHLG